MSAFLGQADGEASGRMWVPAVDLWETENEPVYAFDFPGIPEDKIVEFADCALTVSGGREPMHEAKDDGSGSGLALPHGCMAAQDLTPTELVRALGLTRGGG